MPVATEGVTEGVELIGGPAISGANLPAPKSAKAQLDSIIAALEPGPADDPGMLTNRPSFVPESPILVATPGSLEGGIANAHANNPKLASLAPAYMQQLTALDQAMGHSETVQTMPSTFAVGSTAMQMPREVRDQANGLYYMKGRDGKPHFVRERADKLLLALLGDELGNRVMKAASMRGFQKKPLLWVSQILWLHVETDMKHTFVGTEKFNEAVDRGSASPVMQAMFTCFYQLTVRNISRIAVEKNISALDVLRCIFADICNDLGVTLT